MQVFLIFIFAIVGTVIWTFLDRKRENYIRSLYWHMVAIRYYLGLFMIVYGTAKVFQSQFPFPALEVLSQTYGDSSPMRLVWTFMGYSASYNFFTGGGEILGGVLLFFRKTKTLGALIVIGVMANVAMLNFSYDVPVKLFSTHLILFASFILSFDLKRVIDFFIRNKAVPAANLTPPNDSDGMRTVRIILKSLFLGGALLIFGIRGYQGTKRYGNRSPKPALYGIYDIETYVINGDTVPAIWKDSSRWKQLMLDKRFATIKKMDDQVIWYAFEEDTIKNTVTFSTFGNDNELGVFTYEKRDSNYFEFNGNFETNTLKLITKYKSPNDFLLVNRGYHWINEYPYNR